MSNNGIFEISKELLYHWIGIWITPNWWNDEPLNKALISFLAREIVINVSKIIQIFMDI